ncbi:hypothetical protein GPECTOR_42g781 [Gonium pectorale]|uniref:Glyoxal oxidase N-terminal domain-containing protein n=1 Tax=Gonium pectorale TaxID=33097 RepID=A0A150G9Q7_GONPE|nr:hypothetical protein GPECTOR_42g781 [Gonium pectorale]|eukprot:KXZ46572.1 hypothetical protein GPECTOR_42g781 [Gonium pectorale]
MLAAPGVASAAAPFNLASQVNSTTEAADGALAQLLQGAARSLLQDAPPAPPAITFETLPWRAPVVAVAMISIPGTTKYLLTWRSQYPEHNLITGTMDLQTQETTLIPTVYNQWCHGPVLLEDGTPLLVGGWPDPTPVLEVGLNVITKYDNATNSIQEVGTRLRYERWYATPYRLPDGKVLIVGGTDRVDRGFTPTRSEVWDPRNPAERPVLVPQPERFTAAAGYNWYPFIAVLPRGEILWWGNRAGAITTGDYRVLRNLPELPETFPFDTMYKYTSSIVLSALKPDPSTGAYDKFSMIIFGGSVDSSGYTDAVTVAAVPGSSFSARIDFYYCGDGICDNGQVGQGHRRQGLGNIQWQIEDMLGHRRIMPSATLAPNGKIVIHGGAQFGRAGLPLSDDLQSHVAPATKTLVYDPDAAAGARYSEADHDGIARLYHFSQCLDVSGKILVAGCESCGAGAQLTEAFKPSPDGSNEFRLSLGTLYENSGSVRRPNIRTVPPVIKRGS